MEVYSCDGVLIPNANPYESYSIHSMHGSLLKSYAVKWKSTLLGDVLGITSFGVEIHTENSGIYSKVVVWITHESGFLFFQHGFPLQSEVIPNYNS